MDISVIVCTRNREHAIVMCLQAISVAIQNAPDKTCEIVVVNNGSTDNTSARVEEWAATSNIPVNVVYEGNAGLSNARNCGFKNAKGNLLILTDDDCHLDANYIVEAIRYDAADVTPVLRGGSIHLGDSTDLALTIKYETEVTRWERSQNISRRYNLGNSIIGCNMLLRKSLADQLGLFDNLLGAGSPIHGGEDMDYIFRAYLAGVPIEYVPDMRVYHFHGRKKSEDGYKLFRNYSIGGGALYAKYLFVHPKFCLQLYWDIKGVFQEMIQKKNLFEPQFNFSLKDKVAWCLKGMYMYWKALLLRKLANA